MFEKPAPDGDKKNSNGYLLVDTGVIICHLRNLPGVKDLLQQLAAHTFFAVSAVTLVEIWQGAKPAEAEKTRLLLQAFEVFPLNQVVAERAGHLTRGLRTKGFSLDLADAVIGATALQIGAPILTTNRKHFISIPNLEVLDLQTLLTENNKYKHGSGK